MVLLLSLIANSALKLTCNSSHLRKFKTNVWLALTLIVSKLRKLLEFLRNSISTKHKLLAILWPSFNEKPLESNYQTS
jgi:hypothetical protein